MKKFNQVITIEVGIDSIAQQLLSQINPEFKHREILAEAIIGVHVENYDAQKLTYLYNSLNGFTSDINFKVGDFVMAKDLAFYVPIYTGHGIKGTVKEINKYATHAKLVVEFTHEYDVFNEIFIKLDLPVLRDVMHTNWEIVPLEGNQSYVTSKPITTTDNPIGYGLDELVSAELPHNN